MCKQLLEHGPASACSDQMILGLVICRLMHAERGTPKPNLEEDNAKGWGITTG